MLWQANDGKIDIDDIARCLLELGNRLLAAQYGAKSVGFANPTLYKIANTSAYGSNFHDVVSGCTPNTNGTGDQWCAGSGYDLATGLGSPQHALIYALAG